MNMYRQVFSMLFRSGLLLYSEASLFVCVYYIFQKHFCFELHHTKSISVPQVTERDLLHSVQASGLYLCLGSPQALHNIVLACCKYCPCKAEIVWHCIQLEFMFLKDCGYSMRMFLNIKIPELLAQYNFKIIMILLYTLYIIHYMFILYK